MNAMFGTTVRRAKVMKETSLGALSQWEKCVEEQTIAQPDTNTSSTDFSFIEKKINQDLDFLYPVLEFWKWESINH